MAFPRIVPQNLPQDLDLDTSYDPTTRDLMVGWYLASASLDSVNKLTADGNVPEVWAGDEAGYATALASVKTAMTSALAAYAAVVSGP